MVVFDYTKKVTRKDTIHMKDYVRQQKQVYLNRLKHIQEKLFDYQMQLEELEDDLDNEGRETITHEINTSYQWSDRKNIRKLCEIFNEKNDQYLIEKFMQGFEGRIGNDVYFTLVLATKLLTKIIFPHIKEIIGEKDKK